MIRRFSFYNSAILIMVLSLMMATIYSLISPKAGQRSPAKFVFPNKISLPEWNFTSGRLNEVKISPTEEVQELFKGGKKYKFRRQNKILDVDIYYLSNTRGNIESLLKKHLNLGEQTINNIQIKRTNKNYYGLFKDRDRTYLSTCHNPFGYSTFTHKQFSQNLNSRSLNLQLIGNWLLGKDSIRDRRCLWTIMSIPNQQGTSQELNQTLERTWKDYHQWWQTRFPDL